MRINCTIDGIKHSLNVSSDKPLHRILLEISDSFAANNSCQGAKCGNCIVFLNEQCVLSCLVPACKLQNAVITTFEEFRKSRAYIDIEKAYKDCGATPCPQCYAAKTLLIESLVRKYENEKNTAGFKERISSGPGAAKTSMNIDYISRELSVNRCNCIEPSQVETIIKTAYQNRRRRNYGRS